MARGFPTPLPAPRPRKSRNRFRRIGTRSIASALAPALALVAVISAASLPAFAQQHCGDVVTLATRGTQTVAYSFAAPPAGAQAVLVLLAGGGGAVNLDARGCATALAGNTLVRLQPLFHADGFATALLDAPSDWRDGDGLGGFRTDPRHAADIGLAIADLRRRTGLPVFLLGSSRGTISAANAAARLAGDAAPDALVLISPITSGLAGGRKAWVEQTVFDLDLAAIRVPILVVAHASDTCVRTPPGRAAGILERTIGSRELFVRVEGGPAATKVYPGLKACEGRAPHGYVGQDGEVAAAMAGFLRADGK